MSATTVSVSATSDRNVNGLLAGVKWAGSTLAFALPTDAADYGAGYGSETSAGNWVGGLSPAAQATVRDVLAEVASLTNLRFVATNDVANADLRVAQSRAANPTAYAYYPGAGKGGDVWMGTAYDYQDPQLGSYAGLTYLHELGHALGLKHGQERGGVANTSLSADRDSMEFSVMTYRSYIGGPLSGYTNERYGYAQSYMMYDIAALQALYGADFTTNAGNTVYTFSATTGEMFINGVRQGAPGTGAGGESNRVFRTIWDGGGTDTYNFSNYHENQSIDLRPGLWSTLSHDQLAYLGAGEYARANVFNALQYHGSKASLIENAFGGSGSDRIVGNQANNYLGGNAGNDTLTSLAGNDRLVGGAGNDRLTGGAGHDTLAGGAGADTFYFNTKSDSSASLAAADDILDFRQAQGDHIALSSMDANDRAAGNQAFHFLGTHAFTGHAGELRYARAGHDVYVYGDTNGDRRADFAIHLEQVSSLVKGDFLL